MAYTELKEKILGDARERAKEIAAEAEIETDRIIRKAENEQEQIRANIEKEAARIADERFQNIVTLARVSGRNRILESRQNLVNEVFDAVHERLARMPEDRFKAFARKILTQHPPQETVKIMVGDRNRTMIDQKFLDSIVRETGAPGKFELIRNDRKFDYGFYLITGWMEIDLTFRGIIRSVREETEMDVITTLFGKGQ